MFLNCPSKLGHSKFVDDLGNFLNSVFKTVFASSSFYDNKVLSLNISKLAPAIISWRTFFHKMQNTV